MEDRSTSLVERSRINRKNRTIAIESTCDDVTKSAARLSYDEVLFLDTVVACSPCPPSEGSPRKAASHSTSMLIGSFWSNVIRAMRRVTCDRMQI